MKNLMINCFINIKKLKSIKFKHIVLDNPELMIDWKISKNGVIYPYIKYKHGKLTTKNYEKTIRLIRELIKNMK